MDRTLDEVKQDWLSCVEKAVYRDRGPPPPLTAYRYGIALRLGYITHAISSQTMVDSEYKAVAYSTVTVQ